VSPVRVLGIWRSEEEKILPARCRGEAVEVGQKRGREGARAGGVVRVFPHIELQQDMLSSPNPANSRPPRRHDGWRHPCTGQGANRHVRM